MPFNCWMGRGYIRLSGISGDCGTSARAIGKYIVEMRDSANPANGRNAVLGQAMHADFAMLALTACRIA